MQQIFINYTIYNFTISPGNILFDQLNHKDKLEIPVKEIRAKNLRDSISLQKVYFKYQSNQENFIFLSKRMCW